MCSAGAWHTEMVSVSAQTGGEATLTVSGSEIAQPRLPAPGTTVGRYLVIDPLGAGGMGMVVRAYDPKLQREVALKILHTETLDAEWETRLVREARAMAKLNHPNVVAVYDVERDAEQGTVVAMEYVAGKDLRGWITQRTRSAEEIVAAFVQAGRGLAAAHDGGLLHRDFKPANVLVGEDGRIRVTDFGLARIDRGGRDPSTEGGSPPLEIADDLTKFGTVLGTPSYMAPEQHGTGELTAAADQFAFCVALWELLAGERPYRSKDLEELALAKTNGPPPFPKSVKVPKRVVAAILRGLSRKPKHRWPNMRALVEALEGAYAVRRRNRFVVAGVGSLLVVSAAAAVWWPDSRQPCDGAREQLGDAWSDERRAAVQSAIESTELSYAGETWMTVAEDLDAYADAWAEAHTDACAATRVRGDQSATMMDVRIGCLQSAQRGLDATTALLAEADAAMVERAGDMVSALPSLAPCADVEYLAAAVAPPPPELADQVEDIRISIAENHGLRNAGKYERAAEVIEAAADQASEVDYPPLLTEIAIAEGFTFERRGDYDAAVEALAEGLERALALGQIDEATVAATALIMNHGSFRGEPERALDFAVTAKGLVPRSADPKDRASELHRVLGSIYGKTGDFPRAVEELKTSLELVQEAPGADELDVAVVRLSLGSALKDFGDLDGSQREVEAVIELRAKKLGNGHPRTANARHNLATLLSLRGDLEGANREFEKALATMTEALGPDHPTVGMARSNRAGVLEELGRREEAFEEFKAVVELFKRAYGPDHPNVAMARHNVALRFGLRGDSEAAARELRGVIDTLVPKLGENHPVVATAHINLGIEFEAMDKLEEATAAFEKAVEIRGTLMDEDHIELAEARAQLARRLLANGEVQRSLELSEAAWRIYSKGDGLAKRRAEAAAVLAQGLRKTNQTPERARTLGEKALELYKEAGDEGSVEELREWLAAG